MRARVETLGQSQHRRLFLSFDPLDTAELALRMHADLEAHAFDVCCELERSAAGSRAQIAVCDAVVALLSPQATLAGDSADGRGGLCLQEIAWARFGDTPKPIVPAMASPCQVPMMIFRLQYVDMRGWAQSGERYRSGLGRLVHAISATLDAERGV